MYDGCWDLGQEHINSRRISEMNPTGVVINRKSWLLLVDEPLYSLRFIDREGTQELAVVTRVEELDWYIQAPLPLSTNLSVWQSRKGIWLVAIAYQLLPTFGSSKLGLLYLDPKDKADGAVLTRLLRQDNLVTIFLSEDTKLHYTASIPLAPQELACWRTSLDRITDSKRKTLPYTPTEDGFSEAVREFEETYTVEQVIQGRVIV